MAPWGSLSDDQSELSKAVRQKETVLGETYDLANPEVKQLATEVAIFRALGELTLLHMRTPGCTGRQARGFAKSAKASLMLLEAVPGARRDRQQHFESGLALMNWWEEQLGMPWREAKAAEQAKKKSGGEA